MRWRMPKVPNTTHTKGTPNTRRDTARPDAVSETETSPNNFFLEPKTNYSKLATQKCKVCTISSVVGPPKSPHTEI